MKMMFVIIVLFIMSPYHPLAAQQNQNPAAAIINHYAARSFVQGAVSQTDLEQIVQAGIRAPSAVNRQPWYFTVVRSLELAKKIVPQSQNGNALVIVSAAGDGKINTREIIDCALAAQSVYLAAQTLGYGSRIYTGPIDNLNRNLKQELDLPEGHSAVILVRVGKTDEKIDAVSAASSRKNAGAVVTYK